MPFDQYASYTEQSPFHALKSRASSATMFVTRGSSDHIDGTSSSADTIIAQELLGRECPQISLQTDSFNYAIHTRPQRVDRRSVHNSSSNTWTLPSGDGSERDENDDRSMFIQEYNIMAKKYGVELIVPVEFGTVEVERTSVFVRHGSWIKKKLLRRTSSSLTAKIKPEKPFRNKRSITDLSMQIRSKKDTLKAKSLEELIRLCGSSKLYLPSEYAADTLALPTCFRATAQYLAQYASTSRGIFRIPGSHVTVNALYNHYASQDEGGEAISGTVRRPTLPNHIKYDVHDVASVFKKFLAGLPAGILGSVWLFDAFASIHCQLHVDPEQIRSKQSKIRARMIALAIASTAPRCQREFICAVMGLLSMIGRAAEIAPREDEHGRPLPTSDLMGYKSLGIVFGPLLLGELLEGHDSCSDKTLTLSRPVLPKFSRGRHKKNKSADDTAIFQKGIDKVRVANSITEMLITHWREVVRHMKNLGVLKSAKDHQRISLLAQKSSLRPSASQSFSFRSSLETEVTSVLQVDRSISPTPSPRDSKILISSSDQACFQRNDSLSVKKRRSRQRPMPNQAISGVRSISVLSPTKEETNLDDQCGILSSDATYDSKRQSLAIRPSQSMQTFQTTKSEPQWTVENEASPPEIREVPKQASTDEEGFPCSEPRLKPAVRLTRKISEPVMANAKQIAISYIPGKFMNLQTYPDPTSFPKDDMSRDNPRTTDVAGCKKSTPSLNEDKRQSPGKLKHVRLLSSPTGSLEAFLNESKFLAHVPVSDPKMMGQKATNESNPVPSGLAEDLYIQKPTLGKQNYRTYFRSSSSQAPESFTKDPLTKISQEEDMASLASLAQVIHSRGQSGQNMVYSSKIESQRHPNVDYSGPRAYNQHNQMSNTGSEKIYERESPSTTTITITKRSSDKYPVTPRRPDTDPFFPDRARNGSVKTLAAKFNSGTPIPGHSPSLTRSFERPVSCSKYEPTSTLSETTNPSLESWSRSTYKFRKTPPPFRKVSSVDLSSPLDIPLSRDIIESPLYPKPLSIDRRRIIEGRSPCSPGITPVVSLDSKHHQRKCKDESDVSASIGILIPVSSEPPAKSHAGLPLHTPVLNVNDEGSPRKNIFSTGRGSKASTASEMPSTSIGGNDGKIRGASLLYAQIQSLQRQLRVKTDEANHAKRQLMTKESLQDLSTLAEQLRQAKREMEIWRGRAETAERRLEILSQLLPKQSVTEVIKDPSISAKNSVQHLKDRKIQATEDEINVDQIGTALNIGGDGTQSDNGSHTSDGTVPFVKTIIGKLREPCGLE